MFVKRDKNTKSSDLAFMGIMLAINQMTLYFAGITSFNETIFLGLASVIIGIIIIENGIKNGIIFYLSSAMMAIFIMPNKVNAMGYIFILGLYTIVKYYIEKSGELKREIATKAVYFLIVALVYAIAGSRLIYAKGAVVILIMTVFIMAVYDYAATVILTAYIRQFRGKLKKG